MKRFIYIFLIAIVASFAVQAQSDDGREVKPNEKITEAFEKKYIGEKLLFGWRKVGVLYIVTFQHKGVFKYCSFKANGFWQEAGDLVEKEKIPENVYASVPEMDMTAFLVESFKINTYDDTDGFMLLYETDTDRIELVISDGGKILRQNKYPIPEKKEEGDKEKDANDVDWDDGR